LAQPKTFDGIRFVRSAAANLPLRGSFRLLVTDPFYSAGAVRVFSQVAAALGSGGIAGSGGPSRAVGVGSESARPPVCLAIKPNGNGSEIEARQVVERSKDWLEQALQQQALRPSQPQRWSVGTPILFRGETVTIESAAGELGNAVQFGPETLRIADQVVDLRPAIEKHLWQLAVRELPPRVMAYAARHEVAVARVSVRNQKSRWGSCSRRGTISLNWRLIQTPPHVQDYIILHELMHRRQMNHSARFWREVASVCPDFRRAELWLKQSGSLLRA
jgi:predicted metal-dependent hydrolase